MSSRMIPATLSATLVLAFSAYAQNPVIVQEVTPAVPGGVRTYILHQSVPSVVYEGDIVIGEPLPEIVEIYPVEGNSDFSYTIVNDRRFLVDPETRSIIGIIE